MNNITETEIFILSKEGIRNLLFKKYILFIGITALSAGIMLLNLFLQKSIDNIHVLSTLSTTAFTAFFIIFFNEYILKKILLTHKLTIYQDEIEIIGKNIHKKLNFSDILKIKIKKDNNFIIKRIIIHTTNEKLTLTGYDGMDRILRKLNYNLKDNNSVEFNY